jgi:lipoprotein NlpD
MSNNDKKNFCYLWVTIVVVVLAGCAGGEPIVPVSDLTSPRGRYAAHVVQAGDTLYMIAWEAGLDYRQLAVWNDLVPPYHIDSGRPIRLTAPKGWTPSGQVKARTIVTALPSEKLPESEKTMVEVGSGTLRSEVTSQSVDSKYKLSRWLWPVNGPIIQRFAPKNGNNGVDIGGQKGTPVRAAADGLVVYAGSGLRGYGKLLIIQHNEAFLSAYAHNQELLVREGVTVESGENIAKLGDTDAESPRLHFEIRRNGKPVNPLDYLSDDS